MWGEEVNCVILMESLLIIFGFLSKFLSFINFINVYASLPVFWSISFWMYDVRYFYWQWVLSWHLDNTKSRYPADRVLTEKRKISFILDFKYKGEHETYSTVWKVFPISTFPYAVAQNYPQEHSRHLRVQTEISIFLFRSR